MDKRVTEKIRLVDFSDKKVENVMVNQRLDFHFSLDR